MGLEPYRVSSGNVQEIFDNACRVRGKARSVSWEAGLSSHDGVCVCSSGKNGRATAGTRLEVW